MGSGRAGIGGALVFAAGLAAALCAPAGAAAAACGDSLSVDLKLTQDLDCSGYAGTALDIVHDGVAIDLNGHKLIGPPGEEEGINADGGYDNLVVKDGTIKGFYHAIDLFQNRDVDLSNLKLKQGGDDDDYGIYAGEQRHIHMSHLSLESPGYGFYLYENRDQVLTHSEVTGGSDLYSGVYTGDMTGRVNDVQVKGARYGFYISGPTTGYEVTRSSANGGSYAGFYLSNANAPRDYTLSHNTANNNAEYGFFAVHIPHGAHNKARGNGTQNCLMVHCN